MREILFRGKRKDNSGWVYGDLNQHDIHNGTSIKENGVINNAVISETVGQYIGLDHSNGKLFYDDIIDICVFLVSPSNPDNDQHFRGVVFFENANTCIEITHYLPDGKTPVPIEEKHLPFYHYEIDEEIGVVFKLFDFAAMSGNLGEWIQDNITLVGNIHDNPELLTTK